MINILLQVNNEQELLKFLSKSDRGNQCYYVDTLYGISETVKEVYGTQNICFFDSDKKLYVAQFSNESEKDLQKYSIDNGFECVNIVNDRGFTSIMNHHKI